MTAENPAEPAPGGEPPARVRAGRGSGARRRGGGRGGASEPPAAERPVARVAVDVPLAHLDRLFDYLVPTSMDASAVPGVRVRVRFAGQLLDGFLLERAAASDHTGRLTALARVVSAEPVLTPEVARLGRTVADRYAGTFADVLRLAVPARHATVEAAPSPAPLLPPSAPPEPGPWERYRAGPAFLAALARGDAPRAVWTALPGSGWPGEIALAVQATLAGGRGAVVVVPDGRDADRVDAALRAALGEGRHTVLTADLGPAERYRRWLAVRRGGVPAVLGTRAAMFAPVSRLGLVVIWDDGDDLHAEPHAPYPHVREVLALRAHQVGAAVLVAGHSRTAEAAQLLRTGWARPLVADRSETRRAAPLVRAVGEDAELARDPGARTARLPRLAWQVARDGLTRGPVLVQVPRRGYLPALSCERCRTPARCRDCAGPLALTGGHARAHCDWCGRSAGTWCCPECDGTRFRARVVGARRTAEELGRAFPAVPVRTSGRDAVLATVGGTPALVIATPGAEPVAEDGYAAALLLDGWALLGRPDLRAGEEALRRWLAASVLVRPSSAGGAVVVLAEGALSPVQALVRHDPATFAERELAERIELGFPPAVRLASLTGPAEAVADLLAVAELPAGTDVLGPVPVQVPGPTRDRTGDRTGGRAPSRHPDVPPQRALVRVPRAQGAALAAALRAAQGVRSARKAPETVRVRIDPLELG